MFTHPHVAKKFEHSAGVTVLVWSPTCFHGASTDLFGALRGSALSLEENFPMRLKPDPRVPSTAADFSLGYSHVLLTGASAAHLELERGERLRLAGKQPGVFGDADHGEDFDEVRRKAEGVDFLAGVGGLNQQLDDQGDAA